MEHPWLVLGTILLFCSGWSGVLYTLSSRLHFLGKKGTSKYEQDHGCYWQNCVVSDSILRLLIFDQFRNDQRMHPLGIAVSKQTLSIGLYDNPPMFTMSKEQITRIEKCNLALHEGLLISVNNSKPLKIYPQNRPRLMEKLREYGYTID